MSRSTPEGLADAALDWLVTLNSGSVTEAERAGFEAWLARPGHRAAWESLAGPLTQALGPARAAAGRSRSASALGEALVRAETQVRARRRLLRGALALGGITTGAALLTAERHVPLTQLAADLRTPTGERRSFTLPDGSLLTLSARSAADIDFSASQRCIILRQGALIAEAAPASEHQGRPFIVRTTHGQVRALGTRFVVSKNESSSYVGMLEHRSEVTAANGERMRLDQDQAIRFGPRGMEADDARPLAASAWRRGLLQVNDRPLGEVVDALRAYRKGWIQISPRAAALRVYGSYSLDDTERALAALAETLPIEVRSYGWLVRIE
ncbi:FecR domain-containing protein [Comamonas composti]|uniref:FecR domain-containing protein n=1 Tax=Comamonas composti TaxID=408558 RepID=UPI0003F8DAD3|nr:FecR domain-containing protein [Comamonas composti]